MIDLKTLKQLVKLMADNDLTELDLEDEGEKVKLCRQGNRPDVHYVPAPAGAGTVMPTIAPSSQAASSPAPAEAGASPATTGQTIDSPMVGTFYAASSPDAKAFGNVGDHVDADSVVCIIEAMKVFNEIKAEAVGTITRILVENGQAVEFGQPLFEIEPD